MKYFIPSYWFKLWVLSAPLFNDKTQGINAKSIDNKKIKDWASKNTTDLSLIENQEATLSNNQTYNLNQTNQNIIPFYQTELEISTNKHRHEKSKNRHKRQSRNDITTPKINIEGASRREAILFFNNLKNEIFQFLEKNGIFYMHYRTKSKTMFKLFFFK